jgi:hypothetical protein
MAVVEAATQQRQKPRRESKCWRADVIVFILCWAS